MCCGNNEGNQSFRDPPSYDYLVQIVVLTASVQAQGHLCQRRARGCSYNKPTLDTRKGSIPSDDIHVSKIMARGLSALASNDCKANRKMSIAARRYPARLITAQEGIGDELMSRPLD